MDSTLTNRQQNLARSIAARVSESKLDESFFAVWGTGLSPGQNPILIWGDGNWVVDTYSRGDYDALVEEGLLRMSHDGGYPFPKKVAGFAPTDRHYLYTLTRKLQNFSNGKGHIQENIVENPLASQIMSLDVFISHNSKDAKIASALIDFIRSAIQIPNDKIRCTSVEGYRLPGGASTNEQLKQEVRESAFFIGLLTPNSLKSPYVLFELGARWGTRLPFVPVLSGGLEMNDLPAPLSGINAHRCDSTSHLHQLVAEIADTLSRRLESAAAYDKHLQTLIAVSRLTENASTPKTPPVSQEIDGLEPVRNTILSPPTTQVGKELLELIQQEVDPELQGFIEIRESPITGHTAFLPNIKGSGGAITIKTRLFREAVTDLLEKGWVYPPVDEGKTIIYEYKGTN